MGRVIDINSSLKRIAWAFGCARKGSDEEDEMRRLLLAKIGPCQGVHDFKGQESCPKCGLQALVPKVADPMADAAARIGLDMPAIESAAAFSEAARLRREREARCSHQWVDPPPGCETYRGFRLKTCGKCGALRRAD